MAATYERDGFSAHLHTGETFSWSHDWSDMNGAHHEDFVFTMGSGVTGHIDGVDFSIATAASQFRFGIEEKTFGDAWGHSIDVHDYVFSFVLY